MLRCIRLQNIYGTDAAASLSQSAWIQQNEGLLHMLCCLLLPYPPRPSKPTLESTVLIEAQTFRNTKKWHRFVKAAIGSQT